MKDYKNMSFKEIAFDITGDILYSTGKIAGLAFGKIKEGFNDGKNLKKKNTKVKGKGDE